jgi:hypothetical protein
MWRRWCTEFADRVAVHFGYYERVALFGESGIPLGECLAGRGEVRVAHLDRPLGGARDEALGGALVYQSALAVAACRASRPPCG